MISTATPSQPVTSEPPNKIPKLFARYCRNSPAASSSSASQPLTPLAEYQKYLTMCNCDYDGDEECLAFWQRKRQDLPILFQLAMKVHTVPASSAPVERVFSHGGIIMRPHRNRLSDTMLSNLVFLKCNNLANDF